MANRPDKNAKARSLVVEAVKVADLGARGGAPDFCYCVSAPATAGDRRSARRRRTRLRSGKILNVHNAFLIECQIYDQTDKGARVRLVADIPATLTIRLYEDCPERLIDARVVWRTDRELGLCFVQPRRGRKIGRTELTCLRDRYYALDA